VIHALRALICSMFAGTLIPIDGQITRNPHARIATFAQVCSIACLFRSLEDVASVFWVLGSVLSVFNIFLIILDAQFVRWTVSALALIFSRRLLLVLQHHMDQLEPQLSPLDQLMKMFPKNHPQVCHLRFTISFPSLADLVSRLTILRHAQIIRRHLGCYGISGDLALQVCPCC
jgi:hypothetical protein